MACRVAEEVCNPSTKRDGRASLRRQLLLNIATLVPGRAKCHGHGGPLRMAGESAGAP